MEPGTEMYYILLPRTDLDLKIDTNDTVSKLVLLDNQRITVTMRASNIYYEFGFDMRIREVKSSHLFNFEHNKAVQAGLINSELNEEYWESLMDGIRYFNGTEWVATPDMNSNGDEAREKQ